MTGKAWENTTKENSQLLTISGKRLQQHLPLVNISLTLMHQWVAWIHTEVH